MPTTNIEGPLANVAAGTIDGVTYGDLIQPQRVHENSTGANAAPAVAALKGNLYDNCFNASQIPSNATIIGMELVAGVDFDGSGNSNFGNFGSTGASESTTFKMYFHNGTDYSSALPFLSTPSGGSLNGDSTELTLTGPNKRYLGLSTLGTLAGASDSIVGGITFDPADQADFGFAIVCSAVSASPVYGVIRGIGLRATYSVGATDKIIIGLDSPSKVLDLTSTTSIIGL